MKLALIGCNGHWSSYGAALKADLGVELCAVSTVTDDERLSSFDRAPGVNPDVRRYRDPQQLLDKERPDLVQISCRSDRTAGLASVCLKAGIPVVAEKPLAMDTDSLAALWEASAKTPIVPMHTQRSEPWTAALRDAVRAGNIGSPRISSHQKSYRWGETRPEWFKLRCTFPGVAPYIGIHAFDWIVWILGGEWDEVSGWESAAARPEWAACASHAGFVLRGSRGQIATVTLDYLRPAAAATHGDERVRIAGDAGVLEMGHQSGINRVIREKSPEQPLALKPQEDWFVSFVRSLQRRGESVVDRTSAFRATEIALKAQLAADTGRAQRLDATRYR